MTPTQLPSFIRDRRAEIIADWERAVRAIPVARDLERLVLVDHIPELLERIAHMSEELHQGRMPELPHGIAALHANERLEEGFDLGQVVLEYSILRDCVTRMWHEAVVEHRMLGELRVFDQAIDKAVTASVDRFTQARDRTLQALDRIATAALESRDLDDLLHRLLRALLETTAAVDTAGILLRDGDVLRMRAAAGLEEPTLDYHVDIADGFLGRIAAGKQPLSLSPGTEDPTLNPVLRERGVRALYGVPLLEHGEVFGVAHIGSLTANEFSLQDKRLLGTMAARATAAIRQHMLLDQTVRQANELRDRADEQRFLAEATKVLSSSLDYAETLDKLAQLVVPRLADWCVVDLLDTAGPSRVAIAHKDQGKLEHALAWSRKYPVDWQSEHGPAKVMRTGESELVAEIPDERIVAAARDPEHLAALRTLGLKSYLAVPLVARGRTLGVITLLGDTVRRFSATDLGLARELGNRAGLAIDNGRLYKEEQDAVRLREQILSIVSHDLRNPLATIDLASALALHSDSIDDQVRKQLETIQRSSARMDHIISDLLDMTRIQGGRLVLEKKPVDAARLVRDAIEIQLPIARNKNIDIHFVSEVDGIQLDCDRERMMQVFSNLLGNAIKFCAAGCAITIRARSDDRSIRYEVSDTGPGIRAEDLPHVFDAYYSASRHAGQGTGLGLFICKGIIDTHGGEMSVASEYGHGTTFTVVLPRRDRS